MTEFICAFLIECVVANDVGMAFKKKGIARWTFSPSYEARLMVREFDLLTGDGSQCFWLEKDGQMIGYGCWNRNQPSPNKGNSGRK